MSFLNDDKTLNSAKEIVKIASLLSAGKGASYNRLDSLSNRYDVTRVNDGI